jgi:hypothetical protein
MSMDDPNNTMLHDLYDSSTLKALAEKARPILKAHFEEEHKREEQRKKEKQLKVGTADQDIVSRRDEESVSGNDEESGSPKKNKKRLVDDDENVLKRLRFFVAESVTELLLNKQIHVLNKGAMVPLNLSKKQEIKGRLLGQRYYRPTSEEVVFGLKSHARNSSNHMFQLSAAVCLKCGRFSEMLWNGIYDPVLDQTNFQLPCKNQLFKFVPYKAEQYVVAGAGTASHRDEAAEPSGPPIPRHERQRTRSIENDDFSCASNSAGRMDEGLPPYAGRNPFDDEPRLASPSMSRPLSTSNTEVVATSQATPTASRFSPGSDRGGSTTARSGLVVGISRPKRRRPHRASQSFPATTTA